jgi:GMP synthase (glutamine-hydrolysing)
MKILAIVHQPDAGPGVFADVIAEAGIELDTWCPPEQPDPPLLAAYGAVISFGGDAHPDQDSERPWLVTERSVLRQLLKDGVPILGVCLGAELLAQAAGAAVRRANRPEIGFHAVQMTDAGARDVLLGPIPPNFHALSWHSYQCELPVIATALARSAAGIQAFRIGARTWGIQFHAEVTQADFNSWLDDYEADPDAHGINPEELRAELEDRIVAWNELGRAMCQRFLAAADLM